MQRTSVSQIAAEVSLRIVKQVFVMHVQQIAILAYQDPHAQFAILDTKISMGYASVLVHPPHLIG
jgi:hypothetical protein